MNSRLEEKIISLTIKLKHMPVGKNKHLSFIVKRNDVLAIGCNNYYRTHPISKRLGYLFDGIHSELDAFIRLRHKNIISELTLINTRINSNDEFGMARPCKKCLPWIASLGFNHVYYTDFNGIFVKEW